MRYFLIISILCNFILSCSTNHEKTASVATDSTLNSFDKTGLCGAHTFASIKLLDNLPTPKFRNGIGNNSLSITSNNIEAKKWFNYGLNLLHGFWHIEAYRAFREVVKLDSNCAMGYWGIAMCQPGFGDNNNPLWKNSIFKADALKTSSSPFEINLIDASYILINQGIEPSIPKFRELIKLFPNEPEAIAFGSIIMRQSPDSLVSEEVKTILEIGMKKFPTNLGILHYYIHVMELRKDFRKAYSVCNKLKVVAPSSPHICHMPGHLQYLSGDYKLALSSFLSANKIEEEYHSSEKISYAANQNYIHNLNFITVVESELGNYNKAIEAANKIANIALLNLNQNDGTSVMILFEARILPALVSIRFRNWMKAIEHLEFVLNNADLQVENYFVRSYLQIMRLYCMGMKDIEDGNVESASNNLNILSKMINEFEQKGASESMNIEFRNINETYDIISMARYELMGWIQNINPKNDFNPSAWNEAKDLESYIKYDEPPRLIYPISESKGRLHLLRGEKELAKKEFDIALLKRPHSPLIMGILNSQTK